MHRQSCAKPASVRLDGTVCELASHCMATPPAQKCPTRHTVHTTDPLGLYSPVAHVVQVVDPGTETCVLEHGEHAATDTAATAEEKVSRGHSVHTALAFGLAVYEPATQSTHWACCVRPSRPSVDLPATHGRQLLSELPPVLIEYVPDTQLTHAALPVSLLYFPGPHCTQVPAVGPAHPALHVHTLVVDPLTAMVDPVPHAVHASAPEATLKVPGEQAVHAPIPFGPVVPGLQVHTLVADPCTAENFPIPHAVHTADPTAVL